MPFPLVFDALAQRKLDGQENLIEVIVDAKFYRVQKHLSLTGHLYTPGVILVSSPLWDKLGTQDRQRFVEAAKAGATAQRRKISRENAVALSVLKKNGMAVVSRVDRESFRSAIAPAHAEYVKNFGAETLAAVQAVK
jgi:TRAP-type transport system periplasmic protein